MNYMVTYWNGRSNREKLFATLEGAQTFQQTNADLKATIWQRIE